LLPLHQPCRHFFGIVSFLGSLFLLLLLLLRSRCRVLLLLSICSSILGVFFGLGRSLSRLFLFLLLLFHQFLLLLDNCLVVIGRLLCSLLHSGRLLCSVLLCFFCLVHGISLGLLSFRLGLRNRILSILASLLLVSLGLLFGLFGSLVRVLSNLSFRLCLLLLCFGCLLLGDSLSFGSLSVCFIFLLFHVSLSCLGISFGLLCFRLRLRRFRVGLCLLGLIFCGLCRRSFLRRIACGGTIGGSGLPSLRRRRVGLLCFCVGLGLLCFCVGLRLVGLLICGLCRRSLFCFVGSFCLVLHSLFVLGFVLCCFHRLLGLFNGGLYIRCRLFHGRILPLLQRVQGLLGSLHVLLRVSDPLIPVVRFAGGLSHFGIRLFLFFHRPLPPHVSPFL